MLNSDYTRFEFENRKGRWFYYITINDTTKSHITVMHIRLGHRLCLLSGASQLGTLLVTFDEGIELPSPNGYLYTKLVNSASNLIICGH